MLKNWGTRDWVWLSSYFVVIVSLLLANYYREWETNLSIISSAISIALAVIAIFLTLKQDSENKISTDSKHMDLSQQLRDLNTSLLNKQVGIENVVTSVEESLNAKNEENEKKESYSHEQLKDYGEKVKRETIELFKKELNSQALKELENMNSEKSVKEILRESRYREKKLVEEFISNNENYTLIDVMKYLIENGIDTNIPKIKILIKRIEENKSL